MNLQKTENDRVQQKTYRQYTVGKEIRSKNVFIRHSKFRNFGQKLVCWDSGKRLSTHKRPKQISTLTLSDIEII